MEARFFIADECYNTWRKLFVLTSDNTLYSEYLSYNSPATFKETFNFNTFKENTYKWSGYQSLKEITKEEALSYRLTKQVNWIEKYLKEKGVH